MRSLAARRAETRNSGRYFAALARLLRRYAVLSPAMVHVESEAIREIGYDAASATLFVRFIDGDWYRYSAVPRAVYDAFRAAESHGRFFHDHIRDRYAYAKGRQGTLSTTARDARSSDAPAPR